MSKLQHDIESHNVAKQEMCFPYFWTKDPYGYYFTWHFAYYKVIHIFVNQASHLLRNGIWIIELLEFSNSSP